MLYAAAAWKLSLLPPERSHDVHPRAIPSGQPRLDLYRRHLGHLATYSPPATRHRERFPHRRRSSPRPVALPVPPRILPQRGPYLDRPHRDRRRHGRRHRPERTSRMGRRNRRHPRPARNRIPGPACVVLVSQAQPRPENAHPHCLERGPQQNHRSRRTHAYRSRPWGTGVGPPTGQGVRFAVAGSVPTPPGHCGRTDLVTSSSVRAPDPIA